MIHTDSAIILCFHFFKKSPIGVKLTNSSVLHCSNSHPNVGARPFIAGEKEKIVAAKKQALEDKVARAIENSRDYSRYEHSRLEKVNTEAHLAPPMPDVDGIMGESRFDHSHCPLFSYPLLSYYTPPHWRLAFSYHQVQSLSLYFASLLTYYPLS